jgi:predicted secreted Zn-dependent protease
MGRMREKSMHTTGSLWRSGLVLLMLFVLATCPDRSALARDVSVATKTRFYGISGDSPRELAEQMNRKGPYSREYRRRVWATAARETTWKVSHRTHKGKCRVNKATIKMQIIYTLPQLRHEHRKKRSLQRVWSAMSAILKRHEEGHGRLYRQLASEMKTRLLRLKPQRNCRKLEQEASALVKSLFKQDKQRNERFERKEAPTYRRMARIVRRG